MAQVSMNAYDADVFIPEFKGLMQYGGQMNGDLRYSPDCMNVETPGGVLQPVAQQNGVFMESMLYGDRTSTLLGQDAGTLMYLRRKAYTFNSNVVQVKKGWADTYITGEYDEYVYAQGTYIYVISVVGDLMEGRNRWYNMTQLMLNSTTPVFFTYAPWSWTTYEHNTPEPFGTTGNILLMSNENAGLYAYGNGISGVSQITTPDNVKFRCIARYAERIWGVAGDGVYYSRPFDATDWTQDNNDPANGGGMFREPTFDKDKIVRMEPLGDALIIFSEQRAWRLTGSDPTNFNIQEQLGNGTKYPETIVNMGDRIIMLGEGGLYQYDGYHVYPMMHETTSEIFRDISYGRASSPRAVKIDNKYVLALNNEVDTQSNWSYGIDDMGTISPSVTKNTGHGYRTLVYDMTDGTITQMNTPQIISFCKGTPYYISHFVGEAPLSMIQYEDSNHKTYNKLTRMNFDSWNIKRVTNAATRWVSPWVTMGRQDIKKGGFDFYFTPEIAPKETITQQLWVGSANGSSAFATEEKYRPSYLVTTPETNANTSVTFKISIQTEKKTKTKYYTVNSLTEEEIAAGKEYKMKKLHFGGSGRRFRVIIETEAIDESLKPATPWRLIGGIHIIAETDKD